MKKNKETEMIFDKHRQKYLVETPEEKVRQELTSWLIGNKDYPADAIYTEVSIHESDGSLVGRADIVIEGLLAEDVGSVGIINPEKIKIENELHQNYLISTERIGSILSKKSISAAVDVIPLNIYFQMGGYNFHGSFAGMKEINSSAGALYNLINAYDLFDHGSEIYVRYIGRYTQRLGNFDPTSFSHNCEPLSYDARIQDEWTRKLLVVFNDKNLWDYFSCDEFRIFPYENAEGAVMLLLDSDLQWFVPVVINSPIDILVEELKALPENSTTDYDKKDLDLEMGFAYSKNRCLNLANAAMVIECKRPFVNLGDQVFEQGRRYANTIGAKWLVLDNQQDTVVYFEQHGEWLRYENGIPSYLELLRHVDHDNLVRPWRPRPLYVNPEFLNEKYIQIVADQITVGEDTPRALLPGILEYDYVLTHPELLSVHSLLHDICKDVNDMGPGMRNIRFPSGGDGEFTVRSFHVTWLDGSTETLRFAIFASLKVVNHKRHGNRRGKTGPMFVTNRDGHDACSAHLNFSNKIRETDNDKFLDVIHEGAMTIAVGAVKRQLVLDEIRRHLPRSFFTDKHILIGSIPIGRRISERERSILLANHIRVGRALALTKYALRERKAAGLL